MAGVNPLPVAGVLMAAVFPFEHCGTLSTARVLFSALLKINSRSIFSPPQKSQGNPEAAQQELVLFFFLFVLFSFPSLNFSAFIYFTP